MIVAFASIYLTIISVVDIWKRKIFNFSTLTTCILALVTHTHLERMDGLYFSASGMIAGFFLFLLPFLLSGIGAGDVKAFAALGALIGPSAIFQTFLYTALIGGVIAVVYYIVVYDIREKARSGLVALGAFAASRDPRCLLPETPKKKHKFPYAPAMALGYLAYLAWGNLV